MTIEELQQKAVPVLQKNGVEYAAVFGSVARAEERPSSDVDLLVRYTITPSLITHIGVAQDLEGILGRKVDLITERSLSKYIAPRVKKDLKVLYGTGRRSDLH